MHCINHNSEEFKNLVKELNLPEIVVSSKISIWQESNNNLDRFPTSSELYTGEDLKYTLKAIDIVTKNLKKIQGFWNQIKDKEIFWNKIQKDFGIPKEQIELLKESEGNNFDEKLTNFVANYSYSVEVKTAKQKYAYNASDPEYRTDGSTINNGDPTQYYSNLTVPGGTNYTENEISTPAITPSIKGHAQFSTDQGIGWFRSDEQITKSGDLNTKKFDDSEYYNLSQELEKSLNVSLLNIEYKQDLESKISDNLYETNKEKIERYFKLRDDIQSRNISNFLDEDNREYQSLSEQYINKQGSKTRRILEVQSDWGQKQRKSSEADINIKYDIQQIINDLQKSGELKINCD